MGKKEYQNKERSILSAVCIGVLISISVMLIGVFIVSLLILNETVTNSTTGYLVMADILISTMVGSIGAIGVAKRKLAIVALCSSLIYMLSLISLTAVFYDGQYSGVPATLLLVMCGGISSVLVESKRNARQKMRHKKIKL